MSSLKILTAAAITAATVSLAFAQRTPPRPATDPATGAGQRSTQNTPMGTTGTPGGGGMAQGGTSAGGAAAATAGTAGSTSAPMNAGTSSGARAGGTAVAQDTHTHTHKAAKSKKKAKRVKADRNEEQGPRCGPCCEGLAVRG